MTLVDRVEQRNSRLTLRILPYSADINGSIIPLNAREQAMLRLLCDARRQPVRSSDLRRAMQRRFPHQSYSLTFETFQSLQSKLNESTGRTFLEKIGNTSGTMYGAGVVDWDRRNARRVI